tara:strand:- start:287 stop:523 length:237 start_codon:yes stop_codon:yes gene_type:complete
MSGIFGGGAPAPTKPNKDAAAAQRRSAKRADAETIMEMKGVQSRRRILRSGGMRLLFSPARLEGPGDLPKSTKLGGGN